jgi:hypothetical protein
MSEHSGTVTWGFLSASAIALLLAGGLVLAQPASEPDPAFGERSRAPADSKKTQAPQTGLGESPYDISTELVDAQRRARIWSREACLSEIRVVTSKGQRNLVEISHGEAQGRAMPGAALSPRRLVLKYDQDGVASRSEDRVSRTGRCLPEPNCPLGAAVFAASQAGAETDRSTGGLYLRSTKYDRPVWTLSAPGQELFHVDGDNCALLKR